MRLALLVAAGLLVAGLAAFGYVCWILWNERYGRD